MANLVLLPLLLVAAFPPTATATAATANTVTSSTTYTPIDDLGRPLEAGKLYYVAVWINRDPLLGFIHKAAKGATKDHLAVLFSSPQFVGALDQANPGLPIKLLPVDPKQKTIQYNTSTQGPFNIAFDDGGVWQVVADPLDQSRLAVWTGGSLTNPSQSGASFPGCGFVLEPAAGRSGRFQRVKYCPGTAAAGGCDSDSFYLTLLISEEGISWFSATDELQDAAIFSFLNLEDLDILDLHSARALTGLRRPRGGGGGGASASA